jgi:DNA polymerase III psi subunit
MIDDSQLNVNSTDRKLLYDIRELLKDILKALNCDEQKLPRKELIARVKELPGEKPANWTRLSNDKLAEILKKG